MPEINILLLFCVLRYSVCFWAQCHCIYDISTLFILNLLTMLVMPGILMLSANTEEFDQLVKAHDCSKELLNYVNQRVEESENRQKLVELQRRLDRRPIENSTHPVVSEYKVGICDCVKENRRKADSIYVQSIIVLYFDDFCLECWLIDRWILKEIGPSVWCLEARSDSAQDDLRRDADVAHQPIEAHRPSRRSSRRHPCPFTEAGRATGSTLSERQQGIDARWRPTATQSNHQTQQSTHTKCSSWLVMQNTNSEFILIFCMFSFASDDGSLDFNRFL